MGTKVKRVDLQIDMDRCKECEICISVCPRHLLHMSENLNVSGFHYAELLEHEACTGCGICAQMCPDMAIQIWVSD